MVSGLRYVIGIGLLLAGCASKPAPVAVSLEQRRQTFHDHLPGPLGWVNDLAGIYTPQEEHALDSVIRVCKARTGAEIAIVTLDTMVVAADRFDDLIQHIGNTWGVGEKRKNNGIVIGIATGYRRIRIVNGYGIETIITDKDTRELIDQYFIPAFKSGNYYQGTLAGVIRIAGLLEVKQH